MKLSRSFTATLMALALGLGSMTVCQNAVAWDERAQKSITSMAIQIVKRQFPDAFAPGRSNYDRDVLQGCIDGYAALKGEIPLNSDADTIQAVGTEIQTLRDIRPYGSGSYFAYRMGKWKLLRHKTDEPWELYDLSQDIGEERNLAAQHPEQVARMVDWIAENRVAPVVQIEPEMPEGQRYR